MSAWTACVCAFMCVCVCVLGYLPSHTKMRAAKWKTAGVTPKWGFLDVYRRIHRDAVFTCLFSSRAAVLLLKKLITTQVISSILHTNTYEYGMHTDSDGWWYIENSFSKQCHCQVRPRIWKSALIVNKYTNIINSINKLSVWQYNIIFNKRWKLVSKTKVHSFC